MSVIWQAPSGSGDAATITATCGSSTADSKVTYVYVSIPPKTEYLFRTFDPSDSHTFGIHVEPKEYPVTFSAQSSVPEIVSVFLNGINVTVTDLIDRFNNSAFLRSVETTISAVIPNNDIRVLRKTYNLQKYFDDWVVARELKNAKAFGQKAVGMCQKAVYDVAKRELTRVTVEGMGFGPEICEHESFLAGEHAADSANLIYNYIFPHYKAEHKGIPENKEYSWTPYVDVQLGGGEIKLVPGCDLNEWAWIDSIRKAGGFKYEMFDFKTAVIGLKWKASGGEVGGCFKMQLWFGDQNGKVSFKGAGLYLIKYF